MASERDLLKEAREAYQACVEAESADRSEALDDLRFARLGEQWPTQIRNARERANRPCLTINRLPAFIRQVVNDARQNKPSIRVHPVDSGADVATAKVLDGLIRNIEQASDADVAYDTAADFAVTIGFGYFRVAVDWAHHDSFERDIRIERIANPFAVHGDPRSQAADSSDWNTAFVCDLVSRDELQARWKGAEAVDWDDLGYGRLQQPWAAGEDVMIAEWWTREETALTLLRLSNGEVVREEAFAAAADLFRALGVAPVAERAAKGWKVTQRILTGAEVLETSDWAGRWIPIVPVYGDEVNVEGRRHFRSLIRDAKDPQRMFNYWRTTATELAALQPRAPFIGPEEAFQGDDAAKWDKANTETYSYIAYRGAVPPQRQPMPPAAAGALQEALAAGDDIKSVTGLFDASLGQRSNETSGRAILARQREGDVSTFHFVDNLSRALRHAGRILLDLIPRVYGGERIVRVLGEDGSAASVRLGSAPGATPPGAAPPPAGAAAAPPAGAERIYDLAAGKYDLTVAAGPSYTTRRQEAAEQMMQLLQAFPQAAPLIGDLVARNLDWPGADEIAERLRGMAPGSAGGGSGDPRLQQAMQQMQQQMGELARQLQATAADKARAEQQLAELRGDRALEESKIRVDAFKAETERLKAMSEIRRMQPATPPAEAAGPAAP
ncbi:MAG: portal protein [Dongiaceae bacterium]